MVFSDDFLHFLDIKKNIVEFTKTILALSCCQAFTIIQRVLLHFRRDIVTSKTTATTACIFYDSLSFFCSSTFSFQFYNTSLCTTIPYLLVFLSNFFFFFFILFLLFSLLPLIFSSFFSSYFFLFLSFFYFFCSSNFSPFIPLPLSLSYFSSILHFVVRFSQMWDSTYPVLSGSNAVNSFVIGWLKSREGVPSVGWDRHGAAHGLHAPLAFWAVRMLGVGAIGVRGAGVRIPAVRKSPSRNSSKPTPHPYLDPTS